MRISKSYSGKSRSEIFTSTSIDNDLSPIGVDIRESRDSDEHPESLAIAVFLDVTGSMGRIPEIMVKEKLGALMSTVIKHGIKHPQILFGAIGDQVSDRAPLQISQFESSTEKLDEWLTKIYLEGGGGGGNHESYLLAWLFGARHTSIDCFEKRSQKGFIFTIGDERSWDHVTADQLKKHLGYPQSEEISDEQLLKEAQRSYHIFHIHINEGSYSVSDVEGYWRDLLGQHFLVLDDHSAIGELIASTVAVVNGEDLAKVTSGFDKKIAGSVNNALMSISKSKGVSKNSNTEGIVEL